MTPVFLARKAEFKPLSHMFDATESELPSPFNMSTAIIS